MKVVIADDEVHVCSLITNLIDWDGLGLTLGGVFYNGNDVISCFEQEPVDILLCDIEMPGMSGNELIKYITIHYPACKCIVISGFRVFEYARSAMQYGVTQYLLKPIDGDELNAALKSLIHDKNENRNLSHSIGEQSVRFGLIDLLESGNKNETIESINKKYHYRFRSGTFNIIKGVLTDMDIHSEILLRIMRVLIESIKRNFLDFCIEVEVFRVSTVSTIVLINYNQATFLPAMLDQVLRNTLVELGGKTQCKCCFGVGIAVDNIRDLNLSLQTAKETVCNRFINANKQTFYAQPQQGFHANQMIGSHEKQELLNYIETIDIKGIKKWVGDSFSAQTKLFTDQPYCAFNFCINVVDLMIAAFDDLNVAIANKDVFRRNAETLFDSCSSLKGLQNVLNALIEEEISARLYEKQQNIAVYAQQAKNYIDHNYQNTITLELIAEKLHISPVYLSVVFKNEVGMNYSKYLAQVRIKNAKTMLKNCDMNLSQIANAVGYDSTTYFCNLFRRFTGIKPSEYRRLHQYDIEE